MSPETIVAVSGAVLAVVGALWRAMAILSALERKVDAVSAKLDLHVLDRLGRVEEDVKRLDIRQRDVEGIIAHLPRRVNDRQGD